MIRNTNRHRWVIEHAHAWIAGFDELSIRFKRRPNIHLALRSLAAASIRPRLIDHLFTHRFLRSLEGDAPHNYRLNAS